MGRGGGNNWGDGQQRNGGGNIGRASAVGVS